MKQHSEMRYRQYELICELLAANESLLYDELMRFQDLRRESIM